MNVSPFAGVPDSVSFQPFCEIVAPSVYALADEIVVLVVASTRSYVVVAPLTWKTTLTGDWRLLGSGEAGITDSVVNAAFPALSEPVDSATGAAAAIFDGSVVATAKSRAP